MRPARCFHIEDYQFIYVWTTLASYLFCAVVRCIVQTIGEACNDRIAAEKCEGTT